MQRVNDLSVILALIQTVDGVFVHLDKCLLRDDVVVWLLFNKQYLHQLEE